MTYLRRVEIQASDSASIDAFGRLRVSSPFTLFNSKLTNDKLPLLWDEALYGTGGSAHSAADARVRLSTSAASDGVVRQTFMRFNYQPGKSQLLFMTFLATQEANVRKRVGMFETSAAAASVPQNGVYLEVTSSDVAFSIAKGGSITETVLRGSNQWNIDKLDGAGVSGKTLSMAFTQIMVVDMEWLGVGRVRCGFVIDGVICWVHEFHHANEASFVSVYMRTPNLPLGYSIYQSGAGSGSLDCICSTIISEGGIDPSGLTRTHTTGTTAIACASVGTVYAMLGIKLKTAYDDGVVEPLIVTGIATSTNDSFLLSLRMNPSVASTFTYADKTNSAVQVATGVAANTVTGGEEIWCAHGRTDSAVVVPARVLPRIGKSIAGTLDALVLCCSPLSASVDMFAGVTWLEQS